MVNFLLFSQNKPVETYQGLQGDKIQIMVIRVAGSRQNQFTLKHMKLIFTVPYHFNRQIDIGFVGLLLDFLPRCVFWLGLDYFGVQYFIANKCQSTMIVFFGAAKFYHCICQWRNFNCYFIISWYEVQHQTQLSGNCCSHMCQMYFQYNSMSLLKPLQETAFHHNCV